MCQSNDPCVLYIWRMIQTSGDGGGKRVESDLFLFFGKMDVVGWNGDWRLATRKRIIKMGFHFIFCL